MTTRTFLLAACLVLGACGKKEKAQPSASSTGPGGDAAAAVDGAGVPFDRAGPPGRPPGAVGQIGAPQLSSADAIQHIIATDGRILTCGNRHIRLWDGNGALLWSTVATAGSAQCALSPGGRYLGLTQGDRPVDVRVVDWHAGTEVRSTANERVYGFAFSADDARVAVLGGRVNVRPSDKAEALVTTSDRISLAAFRIDGTLVGVASDRIVTWDVPAGARNVRVLASLGARTLGASFSADANLVAVATARGVVLMDVAGMTMVPFALDSDVTPTQVAISPNGELLALGTQTSVSVWDVAARTRLWTRSTKTSPAPTFSRDGAKLYYADVADVVSADARTGEAPARAARPSFVGWAPAGGAIVRVNDALSLASPTNTSKVEPYTAPAPTTGAPDRVNEEHVGAAGEVVGVAAAQLAACGPLKVWVKDQGEQTLAKPAGCDPDATSAAWQLSAGVAVAAGGARPAVWDVVAKRQVMTIDRGARPLIASAASRDRKVLVVVLGPAPAADEAPDEYGDKESRTGTIVETYALPDGTQLGRARFDREGVTAAAVSADGKRAFLGWSDGLVDAFAPAAVADLQKVGRQTSAIDAFVLLPDGALLAATDEDRVTVFWQVAP